MNKELAQKILNYLATKPYQEVFGLVNELVRVIQNAETNTKVAKDVVEKKDNINSEKVV